MTRHLTIAAAALAVLCLAACERNGAQIDAGAPAAVPPPAPPPIADASAQGGPAAFVAQIGAADLLEVEAARIALQKAQSPEVKAFAQTMIDDHTRSSADLKAAISQAGLNLAPPGALSPESRALLDQLSRTAPAEFDKSYLALQIDSHTQVLAALLKQPQVGGPIPLKTFAAADAPIIQRHLDRAQQLLGAPVASPAAPAAGVATAPAAAPATPKAAAPAPKAAP